MLKRMRDLFWLTRRDYLNEWQMSAFFILSLAAVLAPMMILFGLKFGIITGMLDNLIEDPRNREIRPIGSGHYDREWIDLLGGQQGVGFLIPRTRSIAATLQLKSPQSKKIRSVEMIPTGPGDPLLKGVTLPRGYRQLVLSASAARKLKVARGDRIDGSVARRFRGRSERVHLELTVVDVAAKGAFPRDGAFVPLALMEAVEDFRDGRAVPELGWSGSESGDEGRVYPSFRLYARSIHDVAPLARLLARQGLETRTRAADIEIVESLDRNLSRVFWVIAVIGLSGFAFSLGASLWANVDRKRKELSVLRLVGFRTGDIIWFPVLQSLFTGLLGWLLASLVYLGVAAAINTLFAGQMEAGRQVCQLLPGHFVIALGITLAAAVTAAALAGYRASRIEPSEGLREL